MGVSLSADHDLLQHRRRSRLGFLRFLRREHVALRLRPRFVRGDGLRHGIWHVIRKFKRYEGEKHDRIEKQVLKITGSAFYILAASLAVTSVADL